MREHAGRVRCPSARSAARDRFIASIGIPPLDKGSFWNSDHEGTSVTLFTPRESNGLRDVAIE
jgi:hypothetical protein